jgi:hypothetical protein
VFDSADTIVAHPYQYSFNADPAGQSSIFKLIEEDRVTEETNSTGVNRSTQVERTG